MKEFSFSKNKATLGIAVVVLAAGLAPPTQGNKVYTYDPNTSKITEVCFATLEVDCLRCTSSECPVPDLGGADLGIGVEPDHAGTPSGCGSILFETEKPFLVYNYVNIYGAEHYWRRDRNDNFTDEDSYFWQYGHCIAAKSGES